LSATVTTHFELRAWTDQFDDWPRIRSELAEAVYNAVYKAGMSFPFPQRDVHFLRDQGPAAGSVPADGVRQNSAEGKLRDEEV
jgi:small-conductance mechanosensitive channel